MSATEGGHDPGRFGVFLADELFPWRATGEVARRRAVEAERARLAAEIHARVLPDLRLAAVTAAATPGVPAPIAAGLRNALDDIEGLMAARQSIVLEDHGLLAALEWLAERTEDRSPVRVTIDVGADQASPAADHPRDGRPPRPPRPVERAAFRVALLALDNVVRHARASTASVAVSVTPAAVSVTIRDDGVGLEPAAVEQAGSDGRRGIADMRREASDVGARLDIESASPGTTVAFRWPA
jgi:two-component system NarL family sensor kinase